MILVWPIIILWAIVFLKKLLFWLWLWQLKQYYLKRVLDHFRTAKGKKLIFNIFNLAKIISIFGIIFFYKPFIFLIAFIYLFEAVIFGLRIIKKSFRYPVLTKKSILIVFSGFLLEAVIIFLLFWLVAIHSPGFLVLLLLLDIFSPLLFSLLVLPFRWLGSLLQKRNIIKARQKREKLKNLLVIGITGSYGKTSTKEILTGILEKRFKVFKTLKHQNTDPAVAQYILDKLDSSYQVFVAEMGAYFRGGIKSACDFIQPKIGILTGINQQHLALFGSQEAIIKTKYELIESLPKDGLAVFNGENKYCLELYKRTRKPKKIYSLRNNIDGIIPDVWAEDIKIGRKGGSFRVVLKEGESADFKIKLLGRHSILNILGAVCLAKELGMSLPEIAQACAELRPELGGMVLKKGADGLNIIDSSYSANPDGVISALDYLRVWGLPGAGEEAGAGKSRRKLVIVMPCLIELGKDSKKVHRMIGKKIAEICDLAIITTRDRFKEIKEGAMEASLPAVPAGAGPAGPAAAGASPASASPPAPAPAPAAGRQPEILFLEKPQEIVKKIKEFCQPGDVILLEGRVSDKLVKALTQNDF